MWVCARLCLWVCGCCFGYDGEGAEVCMHIAGGGGGGGGGRNISNVCALNDHTSDIISLFT